MIEQGITTVTHRDILLKRGGIISQREANKEYHELLKSNVFNYKILPKFERTKYATMIFHFIRDVRKRRFIQYNRSDGTYQELGEERGASVISAAIRDDKIAKAANQSNPLWVLGVHDPAGYHQGKPFAYRQADGTWTKLDSEEAKDILLSEGYNNLLILPSGVDLCEPSITQTRPASDGKHLKRTLSQVNQVPSQISLDGDGSSVSAVSLEDNDNPSSHRNDGCAEPPKKRFCSISFENEAALWAELDAFAPLNDAVPLEEGGLLTGEELAFLCNIFDA